eukprot:1160881-Pelagomonas_calceolata.AAC.2
MGCAALHGHSQGYKENCPHSETSRKSERPCKKTHCIDMTQALATGCPASPQGSWYARTKGVFLQGNSCSPHACLAASAGSHCTFVTRQIHTIWHPPRSPIFKATRPSLPSIHLPAPQPKINACLLPLLPELTDLTDLIYHPLTLSAASNKSTCHPI